MIGSWGQAECVGGESPADGSGVPVRPRPTPLFVFAGAFWASAGVVVSTVPGIDGALVSALVGLSGATALACAVLSLARFRSLTAIAVAALFCGAFVGGSYELSLREDAERAASSAGGVASFQAVSDGSSSDYGGSVVAAMELPSGDAVRVRVLFDEDVRPMCGERFTVRCQGVEPTSWDDGWLWGQGVVADVSASGFEPVSTEGPHGFLLDLRRRACALFDRWDCAGSALLKAVLVSDRDDFSSAVVASPDGSQVGAYDAVKVLGLAHLVAVSGSHLVLVAGMAECFLSALCVARKARVCVCAAFILAYLVMAGMPVSAVRAAAMSFVTISSALFERRSSSLSSLGACVVVMVAADPSVAVSLSFQLSALATLGIVLFSGLSQSWLRVLVPSLPKAVRESTALTVSSSVLAQPLSSAVFGQMPLCSLIANVIAAPWFAVLCGGGMVALCASLAVPLLGVSLVPFVWASQAFFELCVILSSVPFVAVPISGDAEVFLAASCVAGVSLWAWWPRPSRGCRMAVGVVGCAVVLVASSVSLVGPRLVPDRIVCLDVGQGDAILMQSDGVNMLVDTGRSDSMLLSGLADFGATSLDAVVISHSDDDHCGSLEALRGVVRVKRVIVAADALECPCDNCADLVADASALCQGGLVGVEKGDRLSCGAFEVEVLSPESYSEEGGNADSLVLLASRASEDGAMTALLCGDAESDCLGSLFEEGTLGHVDVYKVGHHGSKAAIDEEQAEVLSPAVSLVSVGAGNSYGHPDEGVVEALTRSGSAVFRTDLDGAVTCEFEDSGLTVRCERR